MRTRFFLLMFLALAISAMTIGGCAPTEDEIIQGAWETAATQTAGTQQARPASRSYFLEAPANPLAPNLVGSALGGSVDTTVAASSDGEIPTAFGANPTNGDLAYVQYDQASGMSVEVYSSADGSTRQLVNPEAFGTNGVGTMLQYSPDGSQIAFTVATLPSDIDPTALDIETTEFTDEQLAAIQYKAYVANTSDGTLTEITTPTEVAFQMLDWNQSSTEVALNGWSDDNGDGRITFFPDKTGTFLDLTQIYVYDTETNTTTQVTSPETNYSPTDLNYAPTYVRDDLYWLTYEKERNIGIIKFGPGSVYGTDNIIISMAASDDSSHVAWVELPTNAERTALTSPPLLQVATTSVDDPRFFTTVSAELPGMLVPDTPVWTTDGQSVLIGSTNILHNVVTDFADAFGITPAPETDPYPTVLQVDAQSGQTTPLYTGPIVNSGNYVGLLGLKTSGALQ